MKIMIVDDNELMRKTIASSILSPSDVLLECSYGEEALSDCIDFNPDWILMDIRMKKMNGITAAKKIKEVLPQSKIAFVTSYDDESYRRAAKSIGVKYYFLKTNLLEIRKTIERNSNNVDFNKA